jgi:hypothetical protein
VVNSEELRAEQSLYIKGLDAIAAETGLRAFPQVGGPGPYADELVKDAWLRLCIEQIEQKLFPHGPGFGKGTGISLPDRLTAPVAGGALGFPAPELWPTLSEIERAVALNQLICHLLDHLRRRISHMDPADVHDAANGNPMAWGRLLSTVRESADIQTKTIIPRHFYIRSIDDSSESDRILRMALDWSEPPLTLDATRIAQRLQAVLGDDVSPRSSTVRHWLREARRMRAEGIPF